MALIDEKGNYLRIINVQPFEGIVTFEKWENKEHRISGGNEFYRPIIFCYQLPIRAFNNVELDDSFFLLEYLIKASYLIIKKEEPFKNYKDDL